MRPLRNKILVEQDFEELQKVEKTVSNLIISGTAIKDVEKEIAENKKFSFNTEELGTFTDNINAKTSQSGVERIPKNTGVVKYAGKKVDPEEIKVGDRVQFNPHGFSTFLFEGKEYLLMPDEAVLVNLSLD